MKKLYIIVFLFFPFFLFPSKFFSQSGEGGISLHLLLKPNSYILDSVSIFINEQEKISLKVDTNGYVPYVLVEPGTYNVKVIIKDFQTIEILDMIVEPNRLSFQKLMLNPKSKLDPDVSSIIKYVKPAGTYCR